MWAGYWVEVGLGGSGGVFWLNEVWYKEQAPEKWWHHKYPKRHTLNERSVRWWKKVERIKFGESEWDFRTTRSQPARHSCFKDGDIWSQKTLRNWYPFTLLKCNSQMGNEGSSHPSSHPPTASAWSLTSFLISIPFTLTFRIFKMEPNERQSWRPP